MRVRGALALRVAQCHVEGVAAGQFAGHVVQGLATGLLLIAALFMAAADALLAAAEGLPMVAAGVALWGLHMAFSQGVLTALIADVAPEHRRGTAFGVFHLTSGFALLVASAGSGLLWTDFGPTAAFLTGFALALSSAALILLSSRRVPQQAR